MLIHYVNRIPSTKDVITDPYLIALTITETKEFLPFPAQCLPVYLLYRSNEGIVQLQIA